MQKMALAAQFAFEPNRSSHGSTAERGWHPIFRYTSASRVSQAADHDQIHAIACGVGPSIKCCKARQDVTKLLQHFKGMDQRRGQSRDHGLQQPGPAMPMCRNIDASLFQAVDPCDDRRPQTQCVWQRHCTSVVSLVLLPAQGIIDVCHAPLGSISLLPSVARHVVFETCAIKCAVFQQLHGLSKSPCDLDALTRQKQRLIDDACFALLR
jgi:hypothetical protein